MNDVKARLETVAQALAEALSKGLRLSGEIAAKAATASVAAASQGRRFIESEYAKIQSKNLSPFAWSLIAAGGAGAAAALVINLGSAVFDGSSARISQLDGSVAALSRRLDSIEQADKSALAASREALTALGARVAAAEGAISKSTEVTKSTLSEIQKTVSSQIVARAATSGEAAVPSPDLGGIEQRLAALEAKVTTHEAPVGEASHAVEGGHEAGAFPPFESANFAPVLIWLALSFGLLYLLMAKLALPRVENILHARAAKLTKDISEANAFRKRSEEAAAAHEKTIADARAKAQALAQETHVKLNAEADAKRHALETDLNAKLAAAEGKIAETKSKAMANVEGIAGEAASAIVERLTGQPADRKAIDAALTTLKA
ncbi:hypothetical protein [Methylocapsa acidiphila]|uniref:F0F1 ATP synthase subunit B family protein n=1 Tax=Methylocapsa acidiphila TaxID=133552 RepID=UPI00040D7538|nr:hypothetical protein [Methylocapsa acidiphila]